MKFRFTIQSCIDVHVKADNADDARMEIINSLGDYKDELIDTCAVSNGVEEE